MSKSSRVKVIQCKSHLRLSMVKVVQGQGCPKLSWVKVIQSHPRSKSSKSIQGQGLPMSSKFNFPSEHYLGREPLFSCFSGIQGTLAPKLSLENMCMYTKVKVWSGQVKVRSRRSQGQDECQVKFKVKCSSRSNEGPGQVTPIWSCFWTLAKTPCGWNFNPKQFKVKVTQAQGHPKLSKIKVIEGQGHPRSKSSKAIPGQGHPM